MELSILPKMQPPDPPLAELVGIQFGMLAAKEIVRHYLTAFTLLMSQFEFECS
jgi:hypothetical protein